MTTEAANNHLTQWMQEIVHAAAGRNLLGVGLFSTGRSLIYANEPMLKLLAGNFPENLLNPTFDKLLGLALNGSSLIFEGFVTIGEYSKINSSFPAMIFRKNDQLLILAGEDSQNLQEQNTTLHRLNREINKLQRQLIAEKRNLEVILARLDEKNRQLILSNRQKDKLFSVIAHDLKSPFTGISGFAEILKDNVMEMSLEEIKTYAAHIYKSSANTYLLIENLLEWASLQRGTFRFRAADISVAGIVNEVLEQVNEQALEKNITINAAVPEGMKWIADKTMLTSILRNLLTNAIKFSYRNSSIEIAVTNNQHEASFTVTDSGVGMPVAVAEKLFLNDFNESARGTEDEKGSGLGLIICKDFVEMHKGRIWAESEPAKGTTVFFTLPRI